MIPATGGKLHWNYLLAIEQDLETVARYVEFAPANYEVYSIELARLLLAAASEVDSVAKLLCRILAPGTDARNINEYRAVITSQLPEFPSGVVRVPRYGLDLSPWQSWANGDNPVWWRSYNDVKHERDTHYSKATLKNTLNSVAALLLITFTYYRHQLSSGESELLAPRRTTDKLKPSTSLLRLPSDFYTSVLAVN